MSGWIYAGLVAAGLSVGAIALVAAPIAGLWALLALRLGFAQEHLADEQERLARERYAAEAPTRV